MKNRNSFSNAGGISCGQFLFLALALLLVLNTGCGSRSFYETQRNQRLQDCYREYEGTQREQCIEANRADYTEYERQRKEIPENL